MGRQLRFELLEQRCMFAVSSALLNSWHLAGQGQLAQAISGYNVAAGPSPTWPTNAPVGANYSGGNTTPALGDIQKVSYSNNYVYVNTPDFASYVMGPWFNPNGQVFMNFPANQNQIVRIREGTYPSTTHPATTGGAIGIGVNGVAIYNNGDAFSYSNATGVDAQAGDRIWNRQGEFAEKATFDHANAHQPGNGQYHYHVNPTALRAQLNDNIDYVGTTNYFPYDPEVYLTHGQGANGKYVERTANLHHSPIVGWMYDGHPIYGPYGYSDPLDANSAIRRINSGYQLRNITDRTTLPGWAAQNTPISANVAPDSTYVLAANQYGPAVNAANPLGKYGEDNEFVPGRDLDQFNGRFTKTPEFPNGVYAYFITIDSVGEPAFPYILGRQFYGAINSGRVTVTTGDGAVNTVFDVTTNIPPVVSGPTTASVVNGTTFNFTAGNRIMIDDIDAATIESITLTVTSGTLNVNLSGALASGASIAAGANNSSTLTLSGAISQLNAALVTLSYTAPLSGSAATFTAIANDGSASNNLSNIVTTNFTLVAPAVPTIVNRQVFYRGSSSTVFGDGTGNPTSSIDFSKSVLLPGQTTSFANYSNFNKGINGLVVDIADLTGTPTASDFQFATWNGFASVGFTTTGSIPTIAVIPGGGTSGSSRVKIVFADNAIRNTWLRVTVLANANTGLANIDVFYFGNAVGDMNAGNTGSPVTVFNDTVDATVVRQNQSASANSVSITNFYDVNKDGSVNAIDTSIVRQSQLSRIIRFFTAPASFRLSITPTSQRVADMSAPSLDAGRSLTLLSNQPILATLQSVGANRASIKEPTSAIAVSPNIRLMLEKKITGLGLAQSPLLLPTIPPDDLTSGLAKRIDHFFSQERDLASGL